jgi:PAS domain S-box-containing protein
MPTGPPAGSIQRLSPSNGQHARALESPQDGLRWRALPLMARLYVASVIAAAAYLMVTSFPISFANPLGLAALLAFSCLTSAWKVTLLFTPDSGSTLSVSYAAHLMTLLLLGPSEAMLVGVAGAWTQCTVRAKQRYPVYRTAFSMAVVAITIQATGWVYAALGGHPDPVYLSNLPKPLVGAVAAYFFVNTGLVAAAIGLSVRQPVWKVWHDNFLWSGPSFMVAAAAGLIAAVMIGRGHFWLGLLMLAPVYLTYRTYQLFLGRIADQQRHVEETQRLHRETVEALSLARRAERALADEKERLSVTLRSIGDGVIATDLDHRVQLINNAAQALTGWTQEEALGQPFSVVFRNVDRETREPCDNSLAELTRNPDKRGRTRCTVLVARDLTEHPIEEFVAPLRDADGRSIGIVVACRDISDVLKVQQERARADKAASLGLLAGGIAHDFNNILTTIMGNVSMARATISPRRRAASALGEAELACVRARQLTWQLLTFSKGGVPDKKAIALPRTLKESARLLLRGSNVSCAFDLAPDLWGVHADEGQLVQVFNNILINGQQAMPQGGVIEIRARNVVEPEERWEHALHVQPAPYVRISISDTGIGIPEENVRSIFDPYFSTKQKGRGLGLATSYSIIKNHGGYLAVESKPGDGTTMHVNLPALLGHELEDSPQPIGTLTIPDSRRRRVLVMDDETAIRRLAANLLEFLGYNVEAVSNGQAAVARYKRALAKGRPFDVVMLDLVVPDGLDGRETMARLGEIDPMVTGILITGYTLDPVMTEFRKHGFRAVMAKPFTLQELHTTLRSLIPTPTQSVH